MVAANPSYFETSNLAVPAVRGSSFFWSMLALAVLDVVLLFWILNPLSKPSNVLHSNSTMRPHSEIVTAEELKPSPLGAVAKPAPLKTGVRRNLNTYPAVAYNSR